MLPSKPSEDIGDFLDFMALTVGVEAVRTRVPAQPEALARFVELARRPLPPLYLGYLQELGGDDRGLKMADDANPRPEALIDLYTGQDPAAPDVPENGVVIGAFGLSGERTLLYASERAEPTVVVSWWGELGHTSAASFARHLYRQAFLRSTGARGAHHGLHRNDPELFPDACRKLTALGFEAYWFSDAYQACFERDDGAVFYVERTPERTSLHGHHVDEQTRSALARVVNA